MNISYFTKKVELNQELRQRLEKKLDKLAWFITQDAEVSATFSFSRGLYCLELTAFHGGMTLRAEDRASDVMSVIDVVVDKLDRQISSHRKRVDRRYTGAVVPDALESDPQEDGGLLVRTKVVPLKPMNAEEAIQQMELLGHTFFMFLDDQADRVCVVYRRRDGHYGLLEPENA